MITPGIYLLDHKTTSLDIDAGSPFWRRLLLDSQVSNYMPGARSLGHQPIGFVFDVIRKPQIRQLKATPLEQREYTKLRDKACPECKKKSAGPAPHTVDGLTCTDGRVVTDPGGKLYANLRAEDETVDEFRERLRADIGANPDKYYRRGTVVRLDEEERDAAYDAWAVARQIRESQLASRWPRNPDACDSYGSMCAYFPVCSGETSIADPLRYRDADREHEELSAKRRLPLISTSSTKAYRSCARKYFYSYELRRRPASESDALRFGTLMHRGLEVWWQTVNLEAALHAMAGEADPFERAKAEELMRGYHLRWKDEPLDVLAVEAEFVAPLVNPDTGAPSKTWELAGKIDAIVRVGGAAEAAA
jgi:hypothetical protein